MKVTVMTSLVLVGAGVLGCMPRKSDSINGGGSSGLASVGINQPKLKESMKSSMSDAEKTKLYDSLVYQISVKAQKTTDNKDDCDAGVTATSFDSDILALDKAASDTVKVKKGCNYVVSMKYGTKSDDGKSIKVVLLQSWDDKDPSKLSKDDLQKAKPTAAVSLYVTKDGLAYWDISVIQTPGDADVSVNPTLATKFSLKAEKMSAVPAAGGKMNAAVTLTPVLVPSSDIFCGVMTRIEYAPSNASPSEYINLYYGGSDVSKSVVKFFANSPTPGAIDFSTLLQSSNISEQAVVRSQMVYAVCASDQPGALAKIKTCFSTPPAQNDACASENMIK